jgi:23S rRNA pseudouridine2605 synthase
MKEEKKKHSLIRKKSVKSGSGKHTLITRPLRSEKGKAPSKRSSLHPSDGSIRLNKYIANAGICSRRDADKLIETGVVRVNGKVVTELGTKIKPGDVVHYDNKVLSGEALRYVLLNKPKGYISTLDDPQERKTVMDLIGKACKERIYPVGRLDRNTTGLLLLTNDGDLAKKLTHPRHRVRKVYHVELDKALTKNDMLTIADGVELDDGPIAVDAIAYTGTGSDKTKIGVEIHSGRNRIIRRIFEKLEYEVVKLDRVVFASLTKKDLPRGKWRHLTLNEVNILRRIQ